ncbi:hypothetical protein Slin14017_G091930 [Septoria linicola]|nr:hypothetical protein Slin14017_G091930 [Septoria linicola]
MRSSICYASSSDTELSEKRLSTTSSNAPMSENESDESLGEAFGKIHSRPITRLMRSRGLHEENRRKVDIYRRNMHAYMQWQLQSGTLPGYQRIMHAHTLDQLQAWQQSRSMNSVLETAEASTVLPLLSSARRAKAVEMDVTGRQKIPRGTEK